MFIAGSLLGEHRGTPYHQSLKSALTRLADLLPDQISISWETIEQAHSARNSVASRHDLDLFRRLADAVLHHHQIRIVYWSAGRDEVTERVVDPWHLTCVDGDWYVIGWCHLRKERRMFAPSRIRKLESTGEDFTVPNDFHAADFFSGTFRVVQDAGTPLRTIRLQFAPTAAKYVREKIWNESQTLSPTADGGVILELKLHSLVEIRRWVLSWGSECRVLEPTELRDDMQSEARQMISSAQEDPAPPAKRRKARQLPK